ncbi:alpha/beta fold hydrolase [Variovorax sp. UC122_21]|uniref:alpha/beta fold hydrolase n=1 Tax=Variovorax sp. UC122_21 TaxID=3374554 RepID=UPI00375843FE
MTLHDFDLNGERLHVRVEGTPELPSVVFFHSLGLSSAMWASQFDALRDRYHLVAMDCRGHGRSSNRGGFSIGNCVDDAAAVMNVLGVRRAHLVGLSMGGLMAAELAARLDGACRSMVLACSYCALAGPEAQARIESTREFLRDRGIAAFAQMYMDGTACASMEPAVKSEMVALIATMKMDDYLQTLQSILNDDARPALSRASGVRTLVLSGRLDRRVTPAALQMLKNAVPHASVVELDRAGHLANLEDPELFNRTLADFWSTAPG